MENARKTIPGQDHVVGEACQKEIRLFCIHEVTERTRDGVRLENFYYECIYDILQDSRHPREKTHILKHLKAKITRIYNNRLQSLPSDTHASTLFQGEQPSIFPSTKYAETACVALDHQRY
jgi:hypothetical protein